MRNISTVLALGAAVIVISLTGIAAAQKWTEDSVDDLMRVALCPLTRSRSA